MISSVAIMRWLSPSPCYMLVLLEVLGFCSPRVLGQEQYPQRYPEAGPPPTLDSTVQLARAVYAPVPEYPKEARAQHVEGVVIFRAKIGADGQLEDLTIGSGDSLLAPAALATVRQWKFEPKRVDGRAVEAETSICLNFSLIPNTHVEQCGPVVQTPEATHQVHPVYPAEARREHIQGDVLLDAVVGRDGNVKSLKPISGDPLLVRAAMDAAKQWRYTPKYDVNGKPVEFSTKITITFLLQP